MFGNPKGYGKSALMMEMAYRRDEICEKMKIPSGPVLFTDFQGVQSASDAKKRILETIKPLFFTWFPSVQLNYQGGILVHFSSVSLCHCDNSFSCCQQNDQ